MKKGIIFLFAATVMMTHLTGVMAQDEELVPTVPPASPSAATKEDREISDLKERLADKVAQLRKKDQKAFSGFATVKDGTITLINDDSTVTVKIDDSLTKLYQVVGAAKKEIKPDAIKTGSYIIVTGPLVDKTVNANYIYVDEAFIVQQGKVTEINKSDYYVKVMSADKLEYTLDIESSTRLNMLNIKTLEIETTGFSKIKEGDTIHFSAKKDETKESAALRFAAQKILVIPQEYFMK